jgi:inosose dehydratase
MLLDPERIKLGIAPIAWTNDDMPDLGAENTFEQTISEMALAGYSGCEIGTKYPKEKEILKQKLDLRGLQICNAWFSSFLLSKPLEENLAEFIKHRDKLHFLGAKIIGASEQGNSIQGKINLPILENKPEYTAGEWNKVAHGFNEMGKLAQEKGMTLTIHHHMGTGVQTAAEIDRLMELTDPSLVFLLFDTGHLKFSGEDPLAILKKYAERVKHLHLKDIRSAVYEEVKAKKMSFLDAVRAGVFTVPGDGIIDFKPVFDTLKETGYEGWMVVEAEQDPAKANPFEYALKARKYIRDLTGI